MTTTLPAAPPASRPDQLTTTQVADILDRAADLIDRDGLAVGDWWDSGITYEPGTCLCTAGAIGVAAGYRFHGQIERDVTAVVRGYDTPDGSFDTTRAHPAFAAMMWHLRVAQPEQLFDWSDQARPDQVVARLRLAAQELRGRGWSA